MFLTQKEISKDAKIEVDVDALISLCGSCNLSKGCKTPLMEYSGEGSKGILIVGDIPSAADDQNSIQFSGESGRYLGEILSKNKIFMNRDCWKVNAVRCHNDIDSFKEYNKITAKAKLCFGYLHKLLITLKPKFVLILGEAALTPIFGDDFSNRELQRWRGFPFYDEKFDTTFFATFHPRDIKIGKFDAGNKRTFEEDINNACAASRKTQKFSSDQDKFVKLLLTHKEVISVLDRILIDKKPIYIDFETSGLKPYRPGHFIATIAIALSPTEGYAFPFQFNNYWKEREFLEIKDRVGKIFADRDIVKLAQNAKFEDCWASVKIATIRGWRWDTLVASHILDNRSQFSGLKFQTFINFGVRPYDKHLEKYLRSEKGEEFNTVHKAPLKELLTYNGLDCIYGYMLYEKQKSILSNMKGLLHANSFLFNSTLIMSRIQKNGIHMDEKYYADQKNTLSYKINKIKRELMNGREATKFKEQFGRDLVISSGPDLGKLFFEVLGHPAVFTGKMNAKGVQNYKTDKDTLAKTGLPFAKRLDEMKRLTKARDTYLSQFSRETYDGMMHPFFDLHVPVTYRSSSSRPNFQNLPKRDEEIKNAVRAGIVPYNETDVLSEIDFSGAEVITSVCYHKDPTFLAYLKDKSTDMHRDLALQLWQLPDGFLSDPSYDREQKGLAKKIRFYAKNNWTFAEFYGDWYDSCAKNLWENCIVRNKLKLPNGILLEEHCRSVGIYTIEDFIEHCKGVEDDMWNVRFPVYTRWKNNIYKFYLKHGYIETYYGFRFTGPMNKKECCNYPIQGTSFHNLLNVMNDVEKFIWKNKLKSKIIGQIHDSIVSNVVAEEVEIYHRGVSAIISTLHKRIPWLIVPMEAECAITKMKKDGGNMSKLYEIKPELLNGTAKFDLPAIYK